MSQQLLDLTGLVLSIGFVRQAEMMRLIDKNIRQPKLLK